MLSFFGRSPRSGGDLSRRAFLRVGAAGLGALTLPGLLRLEARGAVDASKSHKSVIMVFLSGGPSHVDSYDLKPDQPSEFRSEFRPVRTYVPACNCAN